MLKAGAHQPTTLMPATATMDHAALRWISGRPTRSALLTLLTLAALSVRSVARAMTVEDIEEVVGAFGAAAARAVKAGFGMWYFSLLLR